MGIRLVSMCCAAIGASNDSRSPSTVCKEAQLQRRTIQRAYNFCAGHEPCRLSASLDGGRAMSRMRILIATALVAFLAASLTLSAALAQRNSSRAMRLSGTIDRMLGNFIFATGRDGGTVTVKLADNATITTVLKATVADIKPGDYIGSGAVPQADGSQKAVEVHIFARPQADGGHHYAGWYGAPMAP